MIYDITQPLLESVVFPGDPKPEAEAVLRIANGDVCNLTKLSLCAHNGTHVDAPYHFYKDGKGIDQVPLEKFIGPAIVKSHDGDFTAQDALQIIEDTKKVNADAARRILLKGNATVTLEAAKVMAQEKIYLIGNESQTVGPEEGPQEVHLVLLKEEVVLLEGIRLGEVPDGIYMLNCAPINLTGLDGSPCRAVLMDM